MTEAKNAEAERSAMTPLEQAETMTETKEAWKSDADIQTENPVLGPEYYRAREIAERVLAHVEAEHMDALRGVAKKLTDEIQDKIWTSIVDHLLSDTQYNLQGEIQRRIENAVSALLSGEKWALHRYVLDGRYTGSVSAEKLRQTVASYIPEELQSKRVLELEAEVKRLKESLEWARR